MEEGIRKDGHLINRERPVKTGHRNVKPHRIQMELERGVWGGIFSFIGGESEKKENGEGEGW